MEQSLSTPPRNDRTVRTIEADQSPSQAVVAAVADATGLDAIAVADEFGPLYDAIDPSALDALFDSSATPDRVGGTVTFRYADRTVTVETGDRVVLEE